MSTSQKTKMSVSELFKKRQSGEVKFVPRKVYDKDADCVTYFHEDVSTNSDQLDPFITLFYNPVTSDLIGFKVKCVRMIVERLLKSGKKADGITFYDVLTVAELLSKDHQDKKMHREAAKESELAKVVLPDVR
ncbi:MAG: hypothetical protein DPW14_10575 [Planctomycetes bacterium]|nr:hypothetical protein [Planctomycetota bacterium]